MIKNVKKVYTIFTLFIVTFETYTLALITCPKEILFQIGVTSRCESDNGIPIPCDGFHFLPVKKAYVDCTDGYFNGQQQILTCDFNTGLWSSNPLRCFSICDGNPNYIESFENKTQYKWYAEILKRPAIIGETNSFPGIILSERLIITLEKYFDPNVQWNLLNFVVRIYKPEGSHKDYTIDHIEYKDDRVYFDDDELIFDRICILVLSHENYIKIDKVTKPICANYAKKSIFMENRLFMEIIKAKPEYNLRPEYSIKCFVPHVDDKTDLFCYTNFNSNALGRCPKFANILQTKCPIGYEKVDSNSNDILSTCINNRWIINDELDSGCKSICGEIGNNGGIPQPLIYKGSSTDIKSAPWHVAIYSNSTKTSSSYELICSGSIIHKNIVISAAHCFYNKVLQEIDDPSPYLVGAGKRFYSFKNSESAENFVRITDIHTLGFDFSTLRYDVAILIVAPKFTFTENIKPVCIDWASYSQWNLDDGTTGNIFGWGATSASDILSKELTTTTLKSLSSTACKLLNNKADVTSENFCGISEKGSTACRGDSGGGFVIKKTFESTERYVLWGIISSGIADEYCSDGGLTIFANIQHFQGAIKDIISNVNEKLNTENISKILYHQIYRHKIWTPLTWVQKQNKLKLRTNI